MLKEKHIIKMLKSVNRLYLGNPLDIRLRLTMTDSEVSNCRQIGSALKNRLTRKSRIAEYIRMK